MDALETEKDVEAPSFSEEDLRQGQRLVGEALWLATKTRPDILFTVNAMASHVARNPLPVIRMGKRLLAYLAGTSDLELVMVPPEKGTRGTMTCFTDASFAPYGARSYSATVITYGRAPVLWKAGRQSFVTMSVMEAELYAAAQGYNLLESISSVLQEIEPDAFDKVLAIDNSSAVSMCNGGPGSQRTRHLKVRASFIREAVLSGRLTAKHTPGELQLADLATKLVSKERLWTLLRLWGFIGGKVTRVIEAVKLKMMTFVLVLLSMITSADGREAERLEKEAIPVSGLDELAVVALFVCIAAIALWELSKSMAKFVWRQYKIAKKADKLSRVRKIASEAAEREVCCFDTDLEDSIVLAVVIQSHVPHCQAVQNMRAQCTSLDHHEENAMHIIAALSEIGLAFPIQVSDIASPQAKDMLLFAMFLFQNLPNYVPKTTIVFSTMLGVNMTKNIELTNPSKKAITYLVQLVGSSGNDFAVKEDTIKLEPRQTFSYPVEYCSRFSRLVEDKIMFTSKREGNVHAAAMVFKLRSRCTGRKPRKTINVSAVLYEVGTVDVELENPFSEDAEFTVALRESTVCDAEKNPVPSKRCEGMEAFYLSSTRCRVKAGATGKLTVSFLPFEAW
eukprot:s729_g7.t1